MNEYSEIYQGFNAPIHVLDCGKKCAPHNDFGIPFCCDTNHAVPTAYKTEWAYLSKHTNLWHLWRSDSVEDQNCLEKQTPDHQVLIACLGHQDCQRDFRSITCRAFPFFPYVTSTGKFIGLSYYWEYEERCWAISHLEQVTDEYRAQFIITYEGIFERNQQELENFHFHAQMMRKIFSKKGRAIPLLHRNGRAYKITPHNERLRRADAASFSKFGPYAIADWLPFPDEA
ncbi:MAG: hypothetical protein ABFS03_06125 [Chloroflexota bacterium]